MSDWTTTDSAGAIDREPANDSRCRCGCRFFATSPVIVTCVDGRAFQLGSISFARCLNCSATMIYPHAWPSDGKKTLWPSNSPKAWEIVREVAMHELRPEEPGMPHFHLVDPEDREAFNLPIGAKA